MRKEEAHGLQKAMPHSQSSAQYLVPASDIFGFSHYRRLSDCKIHFSLSMAFFSHKPFHLQQQRKKRVEVVRSFKMSFVTLQYFYKNKETKSTCYADKEL